VPGWSSETSPKYKRHVDMAQEVRQSGGQWVLVCTRTYRDAARKFVKAVREGRDVNYQPASAYEAEYRMGSKDYQVWVRKTA
jgi:hypothetical protein